MGGQVMYESQTAGSSLQVRLFCDAKGLKVLNSFPQKRIDTSSIIRYCKGRLLHPAYIHLVNRASFDQKASRVVSLSELDSLDASFLPCMFCSDHSKVNQLISLLVRGLSNPTHFLHCAFQEAVRPTMQPLVLFSGT